MLDASFDSLFGDAQLDMECPGCNEMIQVTLNDAGSTIVCPHCSSNIHIEDADGSVKETKANVDKSLKELQKTLKNFGR